MPLKKIKHILTFIPILILLAYIAGGQPAYIPSHQKPSPSENELLGKINPANHPDFIQIKQEHASRQGMYMRKEAYKAFVLMHDAAKKEGIHLMIISAFRSFEHQKNLWERKWDGKFLVNDTNLALTFSDPFERAKRVLQFTAMPGTSRHHWGTDIDLNFDEDWYFLEGKGKLVYEWLCLNAGKFGFCQTYNSFDSLRTDGFMEEKWHWSFMPAASVFLQEYSNKINLSLIKGFKGDSLAAGLNIIESYVNQINSHCISPNDTTH